MKTFTIEEIKEWLNGMKFSYTSMTGNEYCKQFNCSIGSILRQIEDHEDGLEAVTERMAEYRKEGKI